MPLSGLFARPDQLLSGGDGEALPPEALASRARALAERLVDADVRAAGLRMDNGPGWICADLACRLSGIPVTPIPHFFTSGQVGHLVEQAGIDALLGSAGGVEDVFTAFRATDAGIELALGPRRDRRIPADVAKVTFTSGTTGMPKGVCLGWEAQLDIAARLARRTQALAIRRHLCVLPLSVLLENVAGVYAALLSGADLVLPPLSEVGVSGSSGFDPGRLVAAIRRHRPDSLILLPQMLKGLVSWLRSRQQRLEGLRFVAVGGARTAPELIHEARALGIPVHEGYGLSECCSVVAVNVPGDDCPGSVGRPLPGGMLRIANDGEIQVWCEHGVRYLGEPARAPGWFDTGDLGMLDESGYLRVHGRKKQVLITAFGRNVSPEWVESELLAEPEIAQAVVMGDASPALFALISVAPGVPDLQVEAAVEKCNLRLPDYARIGAWRRVDPMSPANGQLTANGRVRRPAVEHAHGSVIDALRDMVEARFSGETHDVLSATS